MSESQSSYRQIVKATSLFGGVQFLTIIISLIRSKFIAVFLGPAGIGIIGLLNSTLGLIIGFTNAGLDTSAVKSISAANNDGDKVKIGTEVTVLKRLIWFTGIFGTLITIFLSSWLSKLTFGTTDYTFAFILISITVLFKQLTSGQLAILQGLRRLKDQAKASLAGSFFGLLVTIPLYYYLRNEAIVPSIIIISFTSLLFTWYYSNKVKIQPVNLTNNQVFLEGKSMLKLGFSLSFISLLTVTASYILQIFISNKGGIVEVGLFSAGFAIINSYVGLIFTAMGTDYFPRLAALSNDNNRIRITVIQQAVIAILIITPIIILFITFAPYIIRILYSVQFSPIIMMVSWGILGMLFKAVSWSMGYILIAKGDSKLFIRTSLGFNITFLMINIFGYYFYGLEGVGITFALNYIIHFFCLKYITCKRYDFYFDKGFYKIFILSLSLCLTTFLISYIPHAITKYSLMLVMIVISFIFTLYQLDRKVDLKAAFNTIMKKKNDSNS